MSTLVLDIGRTHVSVCLVTEDGTVLEHTETDNKPGTLNGIDVFDTKPIWIWFLEVLKKTCNRHQPQTIVTTTHGASAAFIGIDAQGNGGLVLDVLDYDSRQYASISEIYDKQRADYAITGSPGLPRGLNLGRQIYWLQETQADTFSKCKMIIPYPQYWAYLLSGIASCEVSSLGAHTDCWEPLTGNYSRLIERQGWRPLFPPIRKAWDTLGPPHKEICKYTGLSPECRILCGIHDSNAAFAYHHQSDDAVTLLSTGTWVIGMCSTDTALSEARDHLLNVNLLGEALPSFRFMGGREWGLLAGDIEGTPSIRHLGDLLTNRIMALPAFTDQGGPFQDHEGFIQGTCPSPLHKKALASLYCAQVTAWCLESFQVTGKIIIDGPFINDEIYTSVLAMLLPTCEILTSTTTHGTALGAARLAIWPKSFNPGYRRISGDPIFEIEAYHRDWCKKINS